ncbi:hypothetical protein [Marinifilum fragile]|uniref:hypothetical protein n=1 Tax=Marinifilum fragile TaxID=570161 RepID=UPI0006D13469|nr:hypothetical protein [Marinifilum fragile]
MKKNYLLIIIAIFTLVFIACDEELFVEPEAQIEQEEVTLKNGKSEFTGFDEWGFNWNAHHFDDYLINAILADHMFQNFPHYKHPPYKGEGVDFWNDLLQMYPYLMYFMPADLLDCKLVMHWNDELISKEGVYPIDWTDSNGWITFKFRMDKDGVKWSHFRKLVAKRSTDYLIGDTWYNEDGVIIGQVSYDWPDLILIKVVNTGEVPFYFYDTYSSPYGSGVGKYKLNK